MTYPVLTPDEYQQLVTEAVAGDLTLTPATLWVQALEPDRLLSDKWDEPILRGLRIQFLNVLTPHWYIHPDGTRTGVLPIVEPLTYDALDELWPNAASPWAFALKDSIHEEMDESIYYFRDGEDADDGRRPIPAFDLANERTH